MYNEENDYSENEERLSEEELEDRREAEEYLRDYDRRYRPWED